MKKYFLHDGANQQGPFDIDELKAKNITSDTGIWYHGLDNWTTAGKIEELKELFIATPPPYNPNNSNIQPSERKEPVQETKISPAQTKKTGRSLLKTVALIVGVMALIWVVLVIVNEVSNKNRSSSGSSYQEKVMTVEEIERSQPTRFLKATGKYNQNFWGDKFKVHGVIKNTATVAAYKDAVVKVTYYSKTNTELGSNQYTIYDAFQPHSETKFELTIQDYKDVNAIGWDVISATSN